MQGINEKLSVQELIDCCNVSGGINGGSTVDAFRHIKLRGITTITDYPTSVEDQGRCRRCHENMREKVKIRDIGHVTDLSERSLMKAVKRRPLVVGFWTGDEFSEYKKGEINTGKGIYPEERGVGVALHCCVLVGYDTEEGGVGEPGEGYWIIRNSYGEDWGDEGCMKMHRDLTNMFRFACYPEDAFLVHEP